MKKFLLPWLAATLLCCGAALAQDANLLPKYGNAATSNPFRRADAKYVESVKARKKGNRTAASSELADDGVKRLGKGDDDNAMRRFNQAWLLEPKSATALRGMATVQMRRGEVASGLALFDEAVALLPQDIDLAVDRATALGQVAIQKKDDVAQWRVLSLHSALAERAPDHTMNLQNWAVMLFYRGDYPGAWRKVKQAEGTPNAKSLDPRFIADLTAKMARPRD